MNRTRNAARLQAFRRGTMHRTLAAGLAQALLGLCFTATIAAQNFLPGVRVNPNAAGTAQCAPVVRSATDGLIHVSWIDFGQSAGGDVLFSTSTDGGKTFLRPVTVAAGGHVDASNQRRANFAVAADGSIHIVWMDFPAGQQPDILYARSTDRGSSFSLPVSVTGDSGKYSQDFPSIATGAGGTVYLCFLDAREKQQRRSDYMQLSFTRSGDNGKTFETARRISAMPGGIGGTCECCATDIAVSASGEIAVVFRSNIANRRDIHLARSRDGGATFDTALNIQSEAWILPACPVTGPCVRYDRNETAHIVWRDARPTAGKNICYRAAIPGGSVETPFNEQLSDTQNWSDRPEVAFTPEGVLFCAYEDGRSGTANIRTIFSLDGGNTFSKSTALETGQAASKREFPSCCSGPDGVRYVVWQDGRRDAGDIFLAADTARLHPVLSSAEMAGRSAETAILEISPNPVRRGSDALVTFPQPAADETVDGSGDGQRAWVLSDALGRRVLSGSAGRSQRVLQLATGRLHPGTYLLMISSGGSIRGGRLIVE